MGLPAVIGSAVAGPIGGFVGNKLFGKKKGKVGPGTTEIARPDPLGDFIRNFTPQLQRSQEQGGVLRGNIEGGYEDLRNRPGYVSQFDPRAMQGDIGRLRQFGMQGGHKTFGEFAETGGWDANRTANYRDRIASQTPAFFSGLQQDLNRRRRASGGGPGYDAASRALSRDAARGGVEAVREGELGMYDDIARNRLAGAQGYSNNFLQGLSAALGGETNIQSMLNSENRYADESSFRNQNAGLGGLSSLYGSTDGQSSQYLNQLLAALGMQHQWKTDERDFRYGAGQNDRNFWSQIITQLLGGAAGAAGAFAGGKKK